MPPAPTTSPAANDADPAAAWRSPIALRARAFSPHVVFSTPVRPIPRITCLAAHDASDTVAVAGYERVALLQFVAAAKESKKSGPSPSSFSELASAKTPGGRAQSVAFCGPSLLLGCDDGLAHLFRFDPSRAFDPSPASTFTHPENAATFHGAQNFAPSPRVRASALHPMDPTRMATSVGPFCFLWNVEKASPVGSIELLPGPVRCIDWAPHSASQLATGGAGGRLCLLDARLASGPEANPKRAVVAEVPAAHELGVRVIRWSPLVPNWLASAGDGGMVRVWDTRMMSDPAASLDCHLGPATGLSWSRVHCEFLTTGGLDGTWRLHSLQLAPTYQLMQHSDSFSTSLAGVEFSRCTVSQIIAASTAGELVGVSLARRFLAPLTASRFAEGAIEERLAETSLYTRDLAAAFEKALSVARRHLGGPPAPGPGQEPPAAEPPAQERAPDPAAAAAASDILALCTPAVYDAQLSFERQLRDYAYFIPPNFPSRMAGLTKVDPEVKKQVEALRTQVKLVAAAGATGRAAAASLSALAREVAESLERDPAAFDAGALQQILEGVAKQDPIRALALGARLGETFASQGRFAAFGPAARALLSPSVFDAPEDAPAEAQRAARAALERAAGDAATVLPQLALMSEVATAVAAGARASALVEIFAAQGVNGWEIVHAPTARRLLAALLELGMHDHWLKHAGRIHARAEGSSMALALEATAAEQILPKLTQAAAEAAGGGIRAEVVPGGSPAAVERLGAVLLPTLAALAFGEGLVPAAALSRLSRHMKKVMGEFEAAVKAGGRDAQRAARGVREAMERVARGAPEGGRFDAAACLARVAALCE